MLTEAQRKELLEFAQALVRTPSLTGEEGDVARLVERQMRAMGYHEVRVDDWGNVVGTVRGGGAGSVLFDAHMDHVPVGERERWSRDPFGGQVEGGRLYGRGASDMKGALAAMVYAVGLLAKAPGDAGTVHVSASVCEEPAEGPALAHVCRRLRPGAVVIGENSELRVNIGQRGRCELHLESTGRPAHSSAPHLGVNAVRKLVAALGAIEAIPLGHDELLGPAILELTDIISHPYPGLSVVPERCRATFDRRLLVEDSPESVAGEIEAALRPLRAADPDLRVEVRVAELDVRTYTGHVIHHQAFARAWKLAPDHPVAATALAALRGVGQSPELGSYRFCTNGSGSAGVLGIPTIGYGPGREADAHVIDEAVELAQLFAVCEGYGALARELSRR